MNILIVFPSNLEALNFKPTSNNVEILVSGIGGFATMYSLTKKCVQTKPNFIIHAGICGSYDDSLQIGDVTNVMIDYFADFGIIENDKWKTGFEMKLISSHKTPFTDGQLIAPANDITDIPKVIGVTTQTITTTKEQRKLIVDTFQPSIESMEGAFVHYVCIQENIPFIHLRAVSNYVCERDKTQWNIPLAIENLHTQIHSTINLL